MTKLTKRQAKSLFNKGELIYFVPCKTNYQSFLCTSSSIKSELSFEDTVADRQHYYCSKINGLRLSFYHYQN